MSRDAEGQATVLFVGLSRILHKYAHVTAALAERDIRSVFYTFDRAGWAMESLGNAPAHLEARGSSVPADLVRYVRVLQRFRPLHVQVSFNEPWIAPLVFIAWTLGYPIVIRCHGGEIMYWDAQSWLRRLVHTACFRASRVVLINELYMADAIRERRIVDASKLHFVHSRVTVRPSAGPAREGRVVLFLNSFKPWRHPEMLVEAAPSILSEVPDARILLVGETPERGKVESIIHQRIAELGLADRVQSLPFTRDPWPYFEMASVFVLPADIIFCNFALLEAMERAVPPVVARVSDADRIVDHGINGLLADQTPEAIAHSVVSLLTNEEARQAMGRAARQKVIDEFDAPQGDAELIRLYESRVWRRGSRGSSHSNV